MADDEGQFVDEAVSAGPTLVKLVPPRVPAWLVERPRIDGRLDEANAYRLTVVVAGAGFGKSTALGARALAHDWAWYTVDRTDRSPTILGHGIMAALRRRLPFLDSPVLPLTTGPADDASADGLASVIVQALEDKLGDDLVLVLDDVHEVGSSPASMRLVESLLRYAPANLHVVLASRHELPFSIVRMRGRGEVLDVSSADLAFSLGETEARLAAAGSQDAELAARVQAVSDGWPAAVHLAAGMLGTGRAEDRSRLLAALSSRTGPVYSYLAEEVFAGEPPETVAVVRTAAQFDWVTAELCVTLGLADAETMLARLARRGLVTAPPSGGEGSYTLHALVREFVLETWPMPQAEARKLHRRAARAFESMGRYRESLESLTAAADGPGIARLVEARWRELTDHADLDVLVEAGAVVPLESRPRIAFAIAHAHTLLGDFDRALEWLSSISDERNLDLLFQLAVVHINRDEPDQALEVLMRAFDPDDGARLSAEGAVMVPAFIAYQLLALGRQDEARSFALRAFEAAGRLPREMSPLAEAHMAIGDVEREDGNIASAAEHYETALEVAERLGNVLATCSARIRRSYTRMAQGRLLEAVEDTTAALSMADRVGFSLFQGWSPNARAETYLALGRLDEASADFETARHVQTRLASNAVRAPLTGLGNVHLARGELAQARSSFEQALAVAERSGNAPYRVAALTGLAYALVDEDEAEAERVATSAVELAGPSRLGGALVARGWVAVRRGDRAAALAAAEKALADARHRGEPRLIADALELRAMCDAEPDRGRIEEAHAIWTRIGAQLGMSRSALALALLDGTDDQVEQAEGDLRHLGVRQPGVGAGILPILVHRPGPPLVIRTLGHFSVLRNGRPVAVSEWQSKKARDLLKVLVAHRGHSVPRDALIEILWPGDDPAKTSNRLSVALNVVRGVLDPERTHEQDHFVASEGDAVRLVLANVSVDVEAFLAQALAALSAHRGGDADAPELLGRAEAAYGGEFLEEERYEDWAAPLRDETREAYLDVLRALATIDAERETGSATYHLRALALDPYDEEISLSLVSLLVAAGRHGEARRAYRQYVDRMREIDVEPAAFTALSAHHKTALSER